MLLLRLLGIHNVTEGAGENRNKFHEFKEVDLRVTITVHYLAHFFMVHSCLQIKDERTFFGQSYSYTYD